jgi:error-prone DNA polymerase
MLAHREGLRARGARDSRDLERMPHRRDVTVAGLVVIRQRPSTANGTLFMLLEDEHGFINVVVRKDQVDPNEEIVKQAQYVLVRGYVTREGDAISVVGREFEALKLPALHQKSRDFR